MPTRRGGVLMTDDGDLSGVRSWPRGSFLAGIDPSIRAQLLALGTRREFAAGARLLTEGDRSRHALLILDGVVKVTADTAEGRTALLAVRVAGDIVGELATLDGRPRMATVTAAGLVRVQAFGHRALFAVLERHPEVAVRLSVAVGAKLRWSTRRRVDFSAYPVAVRLARVLVDLSDTYGLVDGNRAVLAMPLSQPELAALIGASEPAVHRALTLLRRQGVMRTGYRRILIEDLRALRSAADVDAPP